MAGVRYARNRAHHQWADALALEEGARQYPRSYPLAYFEWVWRSPSELPAGKRDDAGATLYRERLDGRAGRATLTELSEAFAFLRRVLEPSSLVVSIADLAAYE